MFQVLEQSFHHSPWNSPWRDYGNHAFSCSLWSLACPQWELVSNHPILNLTYELLFSFSPTVLMRRGTESNLVSCPRSNHHTFLFHLLTALMNCFISLIVFFLFLFFFKSHCFSLNSSVWACFQLSACSSWQCTDSES